VVDEHAVLGDPDGTNERQAALCSSLLVPVRRVDQDGQVELSGELELGGEVLLFFRRLVVESDLSHRDDAVLLEVAGQERERAFGHLGVVRFFRVQGDGAIVLDAELARSKTLPSTSEAK